MHSSDDPGTELHAAIHRAVRTGIHARHMLARIRFLWQLFGLHHSAVMNRSGSSVAHFANAVFVALFGSVHGAVRRKHRAQQPNHRRNGEESTHNDRRTISLDFPGCQAPD